jgi:hypothetical protein
MLVSMVLVFETGSYYLAQAGLKLTILLLQLSLGSQAYSTTPGFNVCLWEVGEVL